MRYLILLLAILIATPAWAGPGAKRLLSVMTVHPLVAFTINGNGSIGVGVLADTGTETIATGAGRILVAASCSVSSEPDTSVYLVVDGSAVDSITCGENVAISRDLSSGSLIAGNHSVRVYSNDVGGAFGANNFRKPKP